MLKIITTLTLFLIGMLAKGQTQQRTVAEFSKVAVANNIELIYTESPVFSLQVETENTMLLQNTMTEVNGKTLKISLKKGTLVPAGETVKVYLSGYDITAMEAASNAKITLANQINADHLDIVLKSGATLKGNIKTTGKTKLDVGKASVFNGRIDARTIKGNFNDNARINLTGRAENASFSTSEVALLYARNFISGSINLHANEKSKAMIHGNCRVAVNVADQAKVTYTGLPQTLELNDEAQSFKYDARKMVSYNN